MKYTLTVSIDGEVWKAFQQQCIQNKTVPSHLLENFMKKELDKKGDDNGVPPAD